ncbi:MAG: hypothetical protein V9E96_20085 [Chitinophagaceae bacterium]
MQWFRNASPQLVHRRDTRCLIPSAGTHNGTQEGSMNAADEARTNRPTNNDNFFLVSYRDHLRAELAEVERRLKASDPGKPSIGFES